MGDTSFKFAYSTTISVADSSQGVTTYQHDGVNNLIETVLPNGVLESREYDELNRLELLEQSLDGSVVASYDYELDDAGNRTSVTEADGRKVEYEYDDLYRLVEEKITDPDGGDRVITYEYDDVGNRLRREDAIDGTTTYVYDDNDRLLSETVDGVTTIYEYDDNGNTISRTRGGERTEYVWDDRDRLVSSTTVDGDVITYTYDDNNIRVSQTVNGVTTQYIVDDNRPYAQVLEEYVDGELQVRYVHGLDLISQERNGEVSVYLVDGLGSTRILTDIDGNVTNTYTYDAFGNLIQSSEVVENNYLFTGEQFDASLEQYYLRARFYDPALGRFTRRDTYEGRIGEPVTLHKYLYANANPVNYVDPTGYFSILSQRAALSILSALAIEAGRSLVAPLPLQAPEDSTDNSDPLSSQRFIYDAGILAFGIFSGTLSGLRPIFANGKNFLSYFGRFGSTSLDDASQYVAPGVGALLRNAQTPKGVWIARETFQALETVAGKAAKKKFISALHKGIVGPTNQQGIKILRAPVNGYTHELKINGSAARILGKFDANGVLIFDNFLPRGLH